MIKSPFKKIQDVALKHLKRLVANDVRPKIVYIRRSPRTESSSISCLGKTNGKEMLVRIMRIDLFIVLSAGS